MGHAGVGCARRSGACARVVVVVKGVAVMVVVFSEENAREYLHEDDDGDEARCAQNFPHWGLGDGEEVSEAFFRPLARAPCWRPGTYTLRFA